MEAFKDWGVPLPQINAYISGTTELIGGLLLVTGLATRLISVPLVFNFIAAFATASRGTLVQIFSGPQWLEGYDAFINDGAFPMLILDPTMVAFGPGRLSIDHLFRRRISSSDRGASAGDVLSAQAADTSSHRLWSVNA